MTPTHKPAKLIVQKGRLCNLKGSPVRLRGLSLGWHNWWPRFYNKPVVKELVQNWNCNVIRAAMGVDHKDGYINKPSQSYQLIAEVIKACIETSVYVIIDWHAHITHEQEAIAFFEKISKEFGKHPNIIYEIFNEPVNQSWNRLKKYSNNVIDAIRKHDASNIILIGCPHWDQDINIVANDRIIGWNNLMYTFHFYAATHKQEMRIRLEDVLSRGLPVFISECGSMNADGGGRIDYSEWNEWMKLADANNLSWLAWCIADKDETCSILKSSASSLGDWQEDDLKEWGRMILQQLNSDSVCAP